MGADARGLAAARARRWFVNLQLRDRTQVGDGDGDRMRRGVALPRSLPLNTPPPLVAEEEPSARLAPLWFGRAAPRSSAPKPQRCKARRRLFLSYERRGGIQRKTPRESNPSTHPISISISDLRPIS